MLRRNFCTVLLYAYLLSAQTDTASLTGQVRDPSGGQVASCNIRLHNVGTGSVRSTVCGSDGHYLFSLLAPGQYEITVEATGFKRFVDSQLHVQVAEQSQLNVPLELGTTTEAVEVTASVSMLNTESVAQGTVISNEKIVSLPLNGRQFIQLALLVPGANAGGRQVQ